MQRKLMAILPVLAMTLALFPLTPSAAGVQSTGTIIMTINSKTMTVNGMTQDVDPGLNTAPIIIDGRTMVPIRVIVEAIGGTVGWDAKAQIVTLHANGVTVLMTIGISAYTVNGDPYSMDTAPIIKNGRTLIPVRFAVESLGCDVDWNPDTKQIIIQYPLSEQAALQTGDSYAWTEQQKSMEVLEQALSGKFYGDYVLVPAGEDFINGEHCWFFDYGHASSDAFTAEEHFAIGDSGKVYVMDNMTGQFVIFTA